MDDLVKMYPKDVKVVFKNLPLDFHPQAMPAAKAAHAAGIQGKFWEMHDLLFDNQKSLADSYYEEAAKTIGLDIEKFKKDFAAPETEEAVKADKELAGKLGVQGTPNFFVNGVNLRGAYPVEEFKKVIDKARENVHFISAEEVPLRKCIQTIVERMEENEVLTFNELIANRWSLRELIVYFLAVLELCKLKYIYIRQAEPFGPFVLQRNPNVQELDMSQLSWI